MLYEGDVLSPSEREGNGSSVVKTLEVREFKTENCSVV